MKMTLMMMMMMRRRRGRRAEERFSSYSYIVSQHNKASEISYVVTRMMTLHPIMDNLTLTLLTWKIG